MSADKMGPRKYWVPGQIIAGTEREASHHIVIRSMFNGDGHAGVVLSQNFEEYTVWTVDVYGNPTVQADWLKGHDDDAAENAAEDFKRFSTVSLRFPLSES